MVQGCTTMDFDGGRDRTEGRVKLEKISRSSVEERGLVIKVQGRSIERCCYGWNPGSKGSKREHPPVYTVHRLCWASPSEVMLSFHTVREYARSERGTPPHPRGVFAHIHYAG